jgi:hypothetical protein
VGTVRPGSYRAEHGPNGLSNGECLSITFDLPQNAYAVLHVHIAHHVWCPKAFRPHVDLRKRIELPFIRQLEPAKAVLLSARAADLSRRERCGEAVRTLHPDEMHPFTAFDPRFGSRKKLDV